MVNRTVPLSIFDANHGQPNWAQTGFTSRELHTNFAGLTEVVCRLGLQCCSTAEKGLASCLSSARLLIIPPPTGRYNQLKQRWQRERSSLFTDRETKRVLAFLQDGGRLLAFAYRFGDSFTQTNLRDLFGLLGCHLNDDAVIDATILRETPPLQMHFDTLVDALPFKWSRAGVARVRWRPSATFTLLPGAGVWPLVLSPGGRCLSFDRTLRRICFDPRPLAVIGRFGEGRFALFGGPHLFETGPFGLLESGDNRRFLQNTLEWLLNEQEAGTLSESGWVNAFSTEGAESLMRVESQGGGERTIASVERILRKTGVLKALYRGGSLP